jgi:hypothetical protein
MKAVLPVKNLYGVPCLSLRSVESHSKPGAEKEGKKERNGQMN